MGRMKGMGKTSFHVSLAMVDFLLFFRSPDFEMVDLTRKNMVTNLPESTGMEPLVPFLC